MADIPGKPKVAETPLELLNTPFLEPGVLQSHYGPIAGGLVGFTGVMFSNYATRRPAFSGIQKHIMTCAAGIAIGYYFERKRVRNMAERDAVLRNYIELHPDDFPPFERVKFKDLFMEWYPIR